MMALSCLRCGAQMFRDGDDAICVCGNRIYHALAKPRRRPAPIRDDVYLTVKEYAGMIGASEEVVRQWCQRGTLLGAAKMLIERRGHVALRWAIPSERRRE